MNATRPIFARRLAGLAAVPALLVGLAACGGDDDSAGGSFCDGANDIDSAFSDVEISSPDSEALTEAVDAMNELDPPAEIADDWDTMTSALEALSEVDMSDPAAAEELGRFEDADAAFTNVGNYLEDECGIEGAGG